MSRYRTDLSPRAPLGSVRVVPSAKFYSLISHGEWASIVLTEWERHANGNVKVAYGGELLIHSSFGSWGHSWGNCGNPFREFLLDLEFDYLFTKLMGHGLQVFDGEASVDGLREKVLEARRAGELDRDDAREIWGEINDDAGSLAESSSDFVSGAYELPHPARELFSQPWEFIAKKYDEQAVGFWRDLWPTFTGHLRTELAEPAKVAT